MRVRARARERQETRDKKRAGSGELSEEQGESKVERGEERVVRIACKQACTKHARKHTCKRTKIMAIKIPDRSEGEARAKTTITVKRWSEGEDVDRARAQTSIVVKRLSALMPAEKIIALSLENRNAHNSRKTSKQIMQKKTGEGKNSPLCNKPRDAWNSGDRPHELLPKKSLQYR